MSIIGSSSGKPAIEVLRASVSAKRPSTTIPMSALVPPMSKVMSLRRPLKPPTHAPPRTPAASPDISVITGFSLTMAGVATPPFEAIIRKSECEPGVAQRTFETADVAAHLRSDERAQAGRGEPLELAELRRDR